MGERILQPDILYRHRGYTAGSLVDTKIKNRLTAELNAAIRNEVWFSSLAEQNDPFDTNPALSNDVGNRAAVRVVLDAFKNEFGSYMGISGLDLRQAAKQLGLPVGKYRQEYHNPDYFLKRFPSMIEDNRRKQSICCFTDISDNPLMWSHYSGSHQSFCYVFALTADDGSDAKRTVWKMRYRDDRPQFTSAEFLKWMIRSTFPTRTPNSPELALSEEQWRRIIDGMVLTKSSIWKYEQEWRSIRPPGEDVGFYHLASYKFLGINFGAMCDKHLVDFVKDVLGSTKQFSRFRLCEKNYSLLLDN